MVHSCIFNDLCVGKHFANVCDVPFSWPFLSRAVPICYAAVNGWSGFWHGVIIAGVERTPDGFCAHAGHSLFDVCNVVFRIFFGIEHASQRLDAHVFTDFQHYEIANTDEVCQWFPELIGGHTTVYYGAVNGYLSGGKHSRYNGPTQRAAIEACNAVETVMHKP